MVDLREGIILLCRNREPLYNIPELLYGEDHFVLILGAFMKGLCIIYMSE